MALNYYAINSVINGRMEVGRRPRFGGFDVLGVLGELVKGLPSEPRGVEFTAKLDKQIVDAFEQVRNGTAPDRILWDKTLAAEFYKACRERDVLAPSAALGRRLIMIRKAPKYFAKRGIGLRATSAIEPNPSIVWEHAHAIEFALVTLKYRHGASIDDVLIDPLLADEFESVAQKIVPTLKSQDIRLAALYLRKTRHLAAKEQSLFDKTDFSAMNAAMRPIGTLDKINLSGLPEQEGLFEIAESSRSLYIGRAVHLHASVERFTSPETLAAMSNTFWRPDPRRIVASVFVGAKFENFGTAKWQLGLIQHRQPLFNWPVYRTPAA